MFQEADEQGRGLIAASVLLRVCMAGRSVSVRGVGMSRAGSFVAIVLYGVRRWGARAAGSIVGGRWQSLYAGARDVEEPFQEAEPTSEVVKGD